MMRTLPALLAMLALAASQCITSPLPALSVDGYPTLTTAWVAGSGLRVRVALPETAPATRAAAAGLRFVHELAAGAPNGTYAFGAPTYDNASCALVWDAVVPSVQLMAQADRVNLTAQVLYKFALYVTWQDQVKMIDQDGAESTNVTTRSSSSALRFNVYVPRYVALDTQITFNAPVAIWAIVSRSEVAQASASLFTVTVVVQVRVGSHWTTDNYTVSRVGSNVSSYVSPLPVTQSSYGSSWTSYDVSVALSVNGACSFGGLDASFDLLFDIHSLPDDGSTRKGSISVALSQSEDWCHIQDLPVISLSGSQDTYGDDSFDVTQQEFGNGDIIYGAASFDVDPTGITVLNATVVSATAFDASGGAEFSLSVDEVACPATGLHSCWSLDTSLFSDMVAGYTYTLNFTYSVVYSGLDARRAVVSRALSASGTTLRAPVTVVARSRSESASTPVLLGAVVALGGLAVAAVAVAVAFSAKVVRERRQAFAPVSLSSDEHI